MSGILVPSQVDETGLNHLLNTLNILKQTGCQSFDARQLWCIEWLLYVLQIASLYSFKPPTNILYLIDFELAVSNTGNPSTNAETLVTTAKVALSRMKIILETMEKLSKSLKEAIQHVTDETSALIRISGFSSLPDDLVARIFELHHEAARDGGSATIITSKVLASVCKRFRCIALRTPGLWEEVSDSHGTDWIRNLKRRNRNPSVYIGQDHSRNLKPINEFLQLLHPPKQWKALHVQYSREHEGHAVFDYVSSNFEGDLGQLKSLTLSRDYYHLHEQTDGVEVEPTSTQAGTMLSEVDDELLSKWSFQNLEKLVLKNIIPTKLQCHIVQECKISFSQSGSSAGWDLNAFKVFLRQLFNLVSLSFSFCGARSLPKDADSEEDDDSAPVRMFNLMSFTIDVQFSTEREFVTDVMNFLDLPNLREMKVFLHSHPLDQNPEAWLDAIFISPPSTIRTFPNVEEFQLSVQDCVRDHLPYHAVLRAIPRVRDLTLDLPRYSEPYLTDLGYFYSCLKDLRSLHFKNCLAMNGVATLKFIKDMNLNGKLKQFDKLEVDGCYKFVGCKGDFERLLGDKFIWKG